MINGKFNVMYFYHNLKNKYQEKYKGQDKSNSNWVCPLHENPKEPETYMKWQFSDIRQATTKGEL